jgi:hypothetical protein
MFVFCLGAFSFVQTISCLQTIFNYSLSCCSCCCCCCCSCCCSVYTIVTISRRSSDSLNHFSRALFTTVSLFHALYTCGCHSSVLFRNCVRVVDAWLGFFLRLWVHSSCTSGSVGHVWCTSTRFNSYSWNFRNELWNIYFNIIRTRCVRFDLA